MDTPSPPASPEGSQTPLLNVSGIELHCIEPNLITLSFVHGPYESLENAQYGYELHFITCNGEKYMRHLNLPEQEIWFKKLDNSSDLVQIAYDHFQIGVKLYHRGIGTLVVRDMINSENLKIPLEIESLDNLEKLEIGEETDVEQILWRTQKQLRSLTVCGEKNCEILLDFCQIYHIQDLFNCPDCHLTYEKLIKITASRIHVNIGKLTEQDISNCLAQWQNGAIWSNLKSCAWDLPDVDQEGFTMEPVLENLDVKNNIFSSRFRIEREIIYIQHHLDASKVGEFCFHRRQQKLIFTVKSEK